MSDQASEDSQVLKFVKPTSSMSISDREELANLIRTVLAPSEIFKMKSNRRNRVAVTNQSEVLKFEVKSRLTGN